MKMFNWVQKKLNWGSDYHRVSSGRASGVFTKDERKGEPTLVACGERNDGMLHHNMLNNILAISSFNHDNRLLSYSTVEEYLQEEVKEDNLRMVTMLQTTGTMISSKYHSPSLLKPLQRKPSIKEVVKDGKKDYKKKMMEMVMVEHVQHSSCELLQPLLDKKIKEKTTLADLLAIEASLPRNYSSLEKSLAEATFITMSSIA